LKVACIGAVYQKLTGKADELPEEIEEEREGSDDKPDDKREELEQKSEHRVEKYRQYIHDEIVAYCAFPTEALPDAHRYRVAGLSCRVKTPGDTFSLREVDFLAT
jgi:hypothetical protein